MSDIPTFLNQSEFVKPVTLKLETIPDVQRVKNHIIDNPGVTVRDIVDSLGLPAQQVRNAVGRLSANGLIRRAKNEDGEKRVRWEAGTDEDYERRQAEFGQPKQTIVSEWIPERRRDPLTAALFGMSNVDRRQD